MTFEWDTKKNAKLKEERGVSFEQAENEILENRYSFEEKTNGERVLIVKINNYTHCVAFEIRENKIRLITIYPSRKYHKKRG